MNLRSLNLDEMIELMNKFDEKPFRAKQLFQWVHGKEIKNLKEAHNISKIVKKKIAESAYDITVPTLVQRQVSQDGTEKYLFQLSDDSLIESVLMKYRGDYSKQRNTLCVSSQVGCRMGCVFCATGALGFQRNLEVGEIISQVYAANDLLRRADEDMMVRNVVFMGMGEPFDNFDNVMKAIDILCDPLGANMSRRRITISTCGLVDAIRRFADYKSDIGLAISLHAAEDKERSAIMPINKRYPLEDLIDACRYYQKKTGRRLSFEYALIADQNDRLEDVHALRSLLYGIDGHVNVIPVNKVSHQKTMLKPTPATCQDFVRHLNENGVPASIRQEKGADINAACGQLKAVYLYEDA